MNSEFSMKKLFETSVPMKGIFELNNDNTISFKPRDKTTSDQEASDSSKKNSDIGELFFSNTFVEGEIEAEFSFKGISHDAMALIIFQKKTISTSQYEIATAGIHHIMGMAKLKRYDQFNWVDVVNVGESGLLVPDKHYKLKLIAKGSTITFILNGVTMFSTNAFGARVLSNVGIICRNEYPVILHEYKVSVIKKKVFVVMQFTKEYNELYEEVILPQCQKHDLEVLREDESLYTGIIIQDIIRNIIESSIIIADITPDNPNVFYEVGYAHALDKFTILLCDKSKRDKLPFDVSPFRTIFNTKIQFMEREKLKKILGNF